MKKAGHNCPAAKNLFFRLSAKARRQNKYAGSSELSANFIIKSHSGGIHCQKEIFLQIKNPATRDFLFQ